MVCSGRQERGEAEAEVWRSYWVSSVSQFCVVAEGTFYERQVAFPKLGSQRLGGI